MKVETKIHLSKFIARDYQRPLIEAFNSGKYTRFLVVWPRRAGKDICAFNLILRAALKKVGVYFYIFPTYSQAKKCIFDSITNTGERFSDFIPAELLAGTNSTELKYNLSNGSLIQLVGSDNIDSLVGTNPQGIVYSEYALQSPLAYQFLRPVLLGNGGWAMFVSTPRGKNLLWDLYQIATNSEDWFCSKLTVDDTQHISVFEINKEIEEGLISNELAMQEYWTSFLRGIEGSIYNKYIDKMRVKDQIGKVPHEIGFKVNVCFDLGVRDSTAILFYQCIGQTVRIIDCYENSKVGLEHYVNVIRRYEQEKGYSYGKFIAPHDIAVKEFGSGMTRLEKAKNLGINFIICPNISIEDGIEAVRTTMSKIWIDESNCKIFLKAIENYRHQWDEKRKVYSAAPLHDWASNFADCLRYLAVSLPKVKDNNSPEKIEDNYRKARYGTDFDVPAPFRQPNRY